MPLPLFEGLEAKMDEPPRETPSEHPGFLADQPRLGLDDRFTFACDPGVSCFNVCCRDVNIVLTPYDVLRLKRRLNLTSSEFLDRYTILPFTKDQLFPIPFLKMNDDAEKTCPFVSDAGCTVYADRPWPCRMYPIGHASSRTSDHPIGEEFWFLVREGHCRGHDRGRSWTIREWMQSQGTEPYDRMGEFYRDLTLHERFAVHHQRLDPAHVELFYMALYDLDKFRRFVFESSFLKRFVVQEDRVEWMRRDDEELLEFGFLWLRFALFGEKTMKVRPEAAKAAMEATKNAR